MLLVGGRAIGLAASFAIGILLARLFAPAVFGTYKQFFLVYGTLYGLAQFGMAESLYYFVPRHPARTGRYVCNALITLAFAGIGCLAVLSAFRAQIATSLSNSPLADYMVLLGLYLTFMLMSTVLEIILVSRKRHVTAAMTYAGSDIARTLLFILPALFFTSLYAVFVGATLFAAIRLVVLTAALWKKYGREFRIDVTLWRSQLAYALPFALAVSVEIVQVNYHQWVVASTFDAATFAIYAIGCMQIPLVDLIMTSTVNVLMVKMAEESADGSMAVSLWHDTVVRLAFLLVPLTVFLLVSARDLIIGLFTTTYAASVPIFMIWTLAILPNILAVDAVLRVYAQTRFLLVMNLVRLTFVAASIGWFLSAFGLGGAVLVTFIATASVKALGVIRIAKLLHIRVVDAMPWSRLGGITLRALAAAVPVFWITHYASLHPLAALGAGAAVYSAAYLLLTFGPTLGKDKETVPCAA
jgi:O-antigen/teichoic acid export membrane protein